MQQTAAYSPQECQEQTGCLEESLRPRPRNSTRNEKSTYLNVRQTLAKLPGHTRRCLCLTLSGKLLREVLWEPVLQRKRSCCSWTDSGISIPWLTAGTSWRWYTVHVIPVKCDVLIKWASITMFLDTCVYDKQLIFCAEFSLTLQQIPEPSAKRTAFLDSSWNSLQDFKMSENRIYGPYHGKVLCVTVKLRPGQRFQTVDDGAACSLLSLGESQDLVFHLHQVTPHLNQHLWQLGQVKKLTVRRRVITQTHTQPLKSLGSLTHCCIDLQ